MTTQALHLRDDAGRLERVWHGTIRVPWHAFKTNGNQAFITSAAVYAGAMFGMQHDVFPWWIAVPLACGFEWTYLAGIALASDTRKGGWVTAISFIGMLTSVVFGMLYILGVYTVIPPHPDPWLAMWLAAAHIIPITLMSFCYAMAHRAHHAQRLTDDAANQKRLQSQADEQHARESKWRDEKMAIELERERIALERERSRLTRSAVVSTSNTKPCPKCGAGLSAGQYSVAHRYGHCKACKGT